MSEADSNPTVNRYLKDKAMDHIDHALGRPLYPLKESHRNYYAANPGQGFEGNPHWERGHRDTRLVYWHVTDAGRAALAAHLQSIGDKHRRFELRFADYTWFEVAISAAKARYSAWLRISDTDSDLTFSHFCKNVKVRVA